MLIPIWTPTSAGYRILSGVLIMKGWIEKARKQGTLRITDNTEYPYCNPMHQTDISTQLNACEKHLWVSKKWFDGLEAAYRNVTK